MPVTSQEIDLVVSITGTFENSGDPYVGVTGDFDGMGISCGVLQWNIGSNSLQPLVRLAGQAVVTRTMPTKGADMWTACTAPLARGLAIVRSWQTGNKVDPVIAAELRSLLGSPEMRAIQLRRITAIVQNADSQATAWAQSTGRTERTLQELVWFFDILTQNGSMKGLTHHDVEHFIASSGAEGAVDVICDWLANAPKTWWGHADCVKNAALWRDAVPADQVDLFVLSYLRSSISGQVLARGVVMNCKGAIAFKLGHVNGTLFDFRTKF